MVGSIHVRLAQYHPRTVRTPRRVAGPGLGGPVLRDGGPNLVEVLSIKIDDFPTTLKKNLIYLKKKLCWVYEISKLCWYKILPNDHPLSYILENDFYRKSQFTDLQILI